MGFHCYFNGGFYPVETPLFQTNDLGLLRGYGLFDYFRTYNSVPFRLNEYWARFVRSAALLHLEVPLSWEETTDVLHTLFRLSGEKELAYRLLLTGGYAPDGVHVVQPNFLVRAEPLPRDNPQGRKTGIKVLPHPYVRDLPEVKSTSYIHMIRMAATMQAEKASDLLFHSGGLVSEFTRSNLFIFRGDTLITPEKDILLGITRKLAMELASPHFKVEVRDVTLQEVLEADEIFTTSTTKWAMPVVQVGDTLINNGKAGKNTLYLQQLMEEYLQNWGT